MPRNLEVDGNGNYGRLYIDVIWNIKRCFGLGGVAYPSR